MFVVPEDTHTYFPVVKLMFVHLLSASIGKLTCYTERRKFKIEVRKVMTAWGGGGG